MGIKNHNQYQLEKNSKYININIDKDWNIINHQKQFIKLLLMVLKKI